MSNQQVVLITGASSGMGKETAKALIKEGYTVYAAARRVDKMEDLKEFGGIPLKMDITKEDEMVAAVEQIEQNHGGVDILINNAGFGLYGPVEDIPLDKARYQFEVNMFGMARLTQLVLPTMRQKRAGKIVLMRGLRRLLDLLATEAILADEIATHGRLPPRLAALLGRQPAD